VYAWCARHIVRASRKCACSFGLSLQLQIRRGSNATSCEVNDLRGIPFWYSHGGLRTTSCWRPAAFVSLSGGPNVAPAHSWCTQAAVAPAQQLPDAMLCVCGFGSARFVGMSACCLRKPLWQSLAPHLAQRSSLSSKPPNARPMQQQPPCSRKRPGVTDVSGPEATSADLCSTRRQVRAPSTSASVASPAHQPSVWDALHH